MKNIIILAVLAILTIAAFVSWNITSQTTSKQNTVSSSKQPSESISSSPTPETGGALRRIVERGLIRRNPTASPQPTVQITVTPLSTPLHSPKPTVFIGEKSIETKGGQIVVSPTPKNVLGSESSSHAEPQSSNVVVLSDVGFSPNSLTVKSGTMVLFLNNSNTSMWIVGDNSSFDMGQAVGKGGSFEYRFTSTGEFGYYNKNNSSQKGRIIITN